MTTTRKKNVAGAAPKRTAPTTKPKPNEMTDMVALPGATTAAASAPAPAGSGVSAPAGSAGGATTVSLPPAGIAIPTPPVGFVAPKGGTSHWLSPTAEEQNTILAAAKEIAVFTNFAEVFGLLGEPQAAVAQAFNAGGQWSTVRTASAAWDVYAGTQERLSWGAIRASMKRMKTLFNMAVSLDPSLSKTCPNLAALFAAKTVAAKKGQVTKRLNDAAVAAGKPPVHGAVGKTRQKAAAKALLLQSQTAAEKSLSAPTATPVVTPAPAPTTNPGTTTH